MTDVPLHLFAGYGIEIEYMIVDAQTLNVSPVADRLLQAVSGGNDAEVERGEFAWSNELALHVIEFKTNGPAKRLTGLDRGFQEQVDTARALLEPFGATLLPGGMHPWMDPYAELKLWPHEFNDVYATFDRIFDCRGHGWANLQSTHINLPFADDREFRQLHAAVRAVLPILPGLAASSPLADGEISGFADTRLQLYKGNAAKLPSVSGVVIPERVYSRSDYEQQLLGRIYSDLAPFDPGGALRHEWVNARGCIARFDRMALEIRLLDVQECPLADIAIACAVTAAVRALIEERWQALAALETWHENRLAGLLGACIRDASQTIIGDAGFLRAFGFPERGAARLADLWQHIIESTLSGDACGPEIAAALEVILTEGTLAERILRALGKRVSGAGMAEHYARLAQCLARGALFVDDGLRLPVQNAG